MFKQAGCNISAIFALLVFTISHEPMGSKATTLLMSFCIDLVSALPVLIPREVECQAALSIKDYVWSIFIKVYMYTGEQETQAMKMSLSHVLMKAWRVPVFWVLAFSVLVSLFKGTTSQCFTGNRPLNLSTVSDYPNRLSTDHLSLPTRNINCQWKIIAKEGDRIALTVMNIDLIYSYSCSNQSITIYDGETAYNRNLGIFCGRQRGQILFSSARFMLIKFISSGSLATGGFNLSYTKAPVDSACLTGTRPTRLTGSSSYFTDLRFPSSGIYYSNNAYCDWLISVSNGYIVQLRVNSVNMETVSGCTRDRLDIYDGTSVYSRSLARICSYYYPTVYSTGTNMLIHFTSDIALTGTGFSVSYKAVLKSSVTTTTAYTYHGGYSGYSGPSTLTIVLLVIGAFLETAVFCFVFYQCRRCKSSRSQTSRSNTAVATRNNVSSRNQRTQIASQDRHDVCTLPTALPTTTAPVSTNCEYSTLEDQPPRNQNPPTNFTSIGPPEYSDAPPSYSEVVNGCYTHDS